MGGSKTVNAQQYISKRDPSRDVAIAMMMQQAQQQQMQGQAEMLKMYAGITPEIQKFEPSAVSKRAAELGVENVLRQRELDRLTNPEAAEMRRRQSAEYEQLTSPAARDAYMREYMRTQGLPSQYETGLGDSTIGRAAMYDRALQARRAFDESLALQQQSYLAQTAEPVGGISPAAAIAAKQAAQAQNIAAQEAYQQGMLGAVGGYGQMAAESAMQQFRNLGGMQQAQQQSEQRYGNAMLENQAQNLASQRAMTGAYIQAGGNIASSALGAYGKMGAGAGANPYGQALGKQLGATQGSFMDD
jgi:hypothetical protein